MVFTTGNQRPSTVLQDIDPTGKTDKTFSLSTGGRRNAIALVCVTGRPA